LILSERVAASKVSGGLNGDWPGGKDIKDFSAEAGGAVRLLSPATKTGAIC